MGSVKAFSSPTGCACCAVCTVCLKPWFLLQQQQELLGSTECLLLLMCQHKDVITVAAVATSPASRAVRLMYMIAIMVRAGREKRAIDGQPIVLYIALRGASVLPPIAPNCHPCMEHKQHRRLPPPRMHAVSGGSVDMRQPS